jgi:type 1 glutamine amidotransferase
MRRLLSLLALSTFSLACVAQQAAAPAKKHLLIIGEEKGYRHESVSHAMATIERIGRESGEWDTTIRTDTEPLTKKKLEYNAKNLNDFDAIVFYTGGTLEMDDEQKASLMQFVKEDGKGVVAVHSAAITWVGWPDYVDMVGGTFDEHPWGTFKAPVKVEDSTFPGMDKWPKEFVLNDEIYQQKKWDRS